MPLFGMFLLFPLLTASPEEDLVSAIERHRERSANDSVVALLRLTALTPYEENIVRLLIANDLAELGLDAASEGVFRALVRHPRLGGAAFVGLARLLEEQGRFRALRVEAERAPWEWMEAEDAAEASFRVARASIATEHFAEAKGWLDRIHPSSSYAPYGEYLRAQAEYALGRYGQAVDAARRIFAAAESNATLGTLRDRTAILIGDMFVEVGLYGYAIDLLSWPAPESPFRERADRDLALARGLAALAEGDLAEGDRAIARFDRALEARAERVAAIVDAPEEIDHRAAELAAAWPSRRILDRRRGWAVARALEALEAARPGGFGRLAAAIVESLPPVIAYRLITRPGDPPPPAEPRRLSPATAPLFAPSPEVSRALVALALVDARPTRGDAPGDEESPERPCAERASDALRVRAAKTLLALDPPNELSSLVALARGCDAPDEDDLAALARTRLREEIAADARRRQRVIREERYLVDDAVARFRLSRGDEIQTLRMPE